MAVPVVSAVAGGFLPQRQQKTLTERAYDLIVLILLIILVVGGLYFLFSFVLTEIFDKVGEVAGSFGAGLFAVLKEITPLGALINIGSGAGAWFRRAPNSTF